MNPRRQNVLTLIRIMSDMVLVSAAWCIAYLLRFHTGLEAPRGIPDAALYLKLTPFIIIIWFMIFLASGFYRRSTKHRSAFLEALDIIQSSILATLAFIAFTYFYEEYRYSRLLLIIFAALHPFMIMTGRSLIRKALRIYRRRAAPRKTLLIGGGDFLEQATQLAHLGDIARADILGVILIGSDEEKKAGESICRKHHLRIFSPPKDWPGFLIEHPVETAIIALPYRSFSYLEEELEAIVNQIPDVKVLPDLMKFTRLAAGIELVSGVPVISIHDSPLLGVGSLAKRAVDIIGSLFALLVFGPLMLIISILVRLSSRGPVFYRQERMGLDGKTFHVLKFRTMPTDAEKNTGPVFATATDNRATSIGGMLRRSSLDELPQFFNVLRGQMSLVGPRPERPVFVHQFRRQIPGYMLRHKVKAGLTGWAQVNGWRGDTSIERRIECDLYYIQNWSLWLDIKIMLLTVLRITRNAY